MRAYFANFSLDNLLSNLLLYLLLAGYFVLIYGVALIFGLLTGAVPKGAELFEDAPLAVILFCIVIILPTLFPFFRWARSRINDIIYGQPDDPYALISEVNGHLQTMSSPQTTLPVVAAAIARRLKLPYVALTATHAAAPVTIEVGVKIAQSAITTLPLRYLDDVLGELAAGWRQAGEALSEADDELLREVAGQIGVALHVVRLSADLQASRERLVISREEERRRIRNDLHDGLGPTLSSLQLQLRSLRNLIRQQPDAAEAIAQEMRQDLRQATAEIRQLVYDLRPPLLDELGLIEAIKGVRVAEAELELEVIAPAVLPALSAALEVAIYRIASEAIHNVIRHAEATGCTVCLAAEDNRLTLVISDNGKGLSPATPAGVGLNSMKERAAELGGSLSILPGAQGGVEVVARFPLAGSV